MRLIGAGVPGAERRLAVRVPGDIPVKLYDGERTIARAIVDITEGGVRIRTEEQPPRRTTSTSSCRCRTIRCAR